MQKVLISIIIALINYAFINADVLIWSTKKFEISPLLPFGDDGLERLIEELGNPKVFKFKLNLKSPNRIPANIEELLEGHFSAFNANGQLGHENAIEIPPPIEKCNLVSLLEVKELISMLGNGTDFLAAIDIAYDREVSRIEKREISEENSTEVESVAEPKNDIPSKPRKSGGSVVYSAEKNGLYGILYSSKDLVLQVDNEEPIKLGETNDDLVTVDTRLSVIIPLENNNKITLRFSFIWLHGYWYLPSVKVTDTDGKFNYNLTTDDDIMAPAHFSYHCSGPTVFSDNATNVKLYIYDLQVQMDSKNGKFGDANDCVPFTTAPIWSGLFVTTILGLGLIVALTAIMDIKTMDKFDNHKTKNLSITISE